MSDITPWLRQYNYHEDFFYTTYKYYVDTYPAFPVTYYSTDREETVWDEEYMKAGTYEMRGVGNLSGQKFRKIQMLPVFYVEQVTPSQESDEKGINYSETMRTRIAFPSVYGLKPFADDAIDMSFGLKDPSIKTKNMYTIEKVDLAHHGEYLQLFNCTLKIAPYTKDMIEKQISTRWAFYEHEKTILPIDHTQILLDLQERSINLADTTRDFYNPSGFYFMEREM